MDMDWFSYLVAGVMVYVAVAVFVIGMAYQISQWLGAPKTRVKTGYFPKPQASGERWLAGRQSGKEIEVRIRAGSLMDRDGPKDRSGCSRVGGHRPGLNLS